MMPEQPQYALTAIREEFNEYALDDGNMLKIKESLVSLVPSKERRKDRHGNTFQNVSGKLSQVCVLVPQGDADGRLEPIGTNSVTKKDRIKRSEFEPRHESLNIYRVDRHYIFIKSKLYEVWTTRFKDKNSLPVYSFSTKIALEIKPIDEIAVISD